MLEPAEHRYPGARALVLLHDQRIRDFLLTWRDAKEAHIVLPKTDDPTYQSYAGLVHHVLRCSKDYMTWMCEKLELPNPGIKPVPDISCVELALSEYVEHLLTKWQAPLAHVEPRCFYEATYEARWGVHYCIDAMLEHAVMHPIRHQFQLLELLEART